MTEKKDLLTEAMEAYNSLPQKDKIKALSLMFTTLNQFFIQTSTDMIKNIRDLQAMDRLLTDLGPIEDTKMEVVVQDYREMIAILKQFEKFEKDIWEVEDKMIALSNKIKKETGTTAKVPSTVAQVLNAFDNVVPFKGKKTDLH